MRIIGGKYKARIFNPGKSFKARPTTDFAKESLFNILNNRIDFEETKVLDLFSGTGSIGYEFLSRGCKDLTMLELNYKYFKFIKSVIAELGEEARVLRGDFFKFVKNQHEQYDLIFADPPYDHPRFDEVPALILNNKRLNEDGILIVEHPSEYDFSSIEGFSELRKYGKVHFSFFKA